MSSKVTVDGRSPLNTGPHDPVTINLAFGVVEDSQPIARMEKMKDKVNWKKVNLERYCELTDQRISALGCQGFENIHPNILVSRLNEILLDSAYESQEAPRKAKKRVIGKPWSRELMPYIKASKAAHYEWKQAPEDLACNAKRKAAKRQLRSAQRKLIANRREEEQQRIMETEEYDREDFFKLVARRRKDVLCTATVHFQNPVTCQLDGWKNYFQELATPTMSMENDHNQLQLHILDDLTYHSAPLDPVTQQTVGKHVTSLKNGKAADVYGLTSEHLKYAAPVAIEAITQVTNNTLHSGTLVPQFKHGIITPVLKPGKTPTNPDSYRRITVGSQIGKVVEKELTRRLRDILDTCQNPLQFGFTEGCSPSTCALIVTEAIGEALDNGENLYITYMDVRKAFDTVCHSSMLLSMYDQGVGGTLWKTFRDMYNNITAQVKLQGHLSENLEELQGIRQGGISSTELFKGKTNYLLQKAGTHRLAYRIGIHPVGAPTTADDTALISSSHYGAQTLIGIAQVDAEAHRYSFNEKKTKVMVVNKQRSTIEPLLKLNETLIGTSEQERHLGLERTSDSSAKATVLSRIKEGRRSAYRLAGAGLYGLNGVGPGVTFQMLKIYIVPILTYGLEALILHDKEYQLLEVFYKSLLRRIQHLPENTATPAVYLLLGAIPIEGQIHIKMLTFFCNILRRTGTVEYSVIQRQLAIKDLNSNSWVTQIRTVLAKYNLPSAYVLLRSTPTRNQWKEQVAKAVNAYWMEELRIKASTMKTLEYLDLNICQAGHLHSVWSHNSDPKAAHMATVKVRLIVQRYPLGYSHYAGKGKQKLCALCSQSEETVVHFLLDCPTTACVREKCLYKIHAYLRENEVTGVKTEKDMLNLILMTSTIVRPHLVPRMEELSRRLVYRLHCRRSGLLGVANSKKDSVVVHTKGGPVR
jgi:hypothetical protein